MFDQTNFRCLHENLLDVFIRAKYCFLLYIDSYILFCLPISTTSLATGRPNLVSYNRTTGFFVTTSIISANTSKSSIGNEGTRCIARIKGLSSKFGFDMGRQILRAPRSQGLSKSYISHLILINFHTLITF